MHYRHHYLNYGQTERAALLWAVAVGTLLGVWPHQYLLLRYGARYVLFVAGLISALATAAIPLLAFLGLPWLIVARTAQLCQTKYGWPSVFYVHSFIGFIIMLAWLICYEDDPKQHPQVSLIELEKIDRDKTEAHKNHDRFVPYSISVDGFSFDESRPFSGLQKEHYD
ncbi:Sodium-dependent phosphate transport protein 1 [Toxocara canis]|uniref:Sodium-dependent phosphate transport protein 1 n=1 Tax=Toxocara canis TaxID=6265 RepID=A0A0B2VS14_TOXCA|nr:Sodium-dependent phosphate transport protein 1 [Toxocara canis]